MFISFAAFGMCLGCANAPRVIPSGFRGEFSFDRPATVAYWNAQSDWPPEAKQQLATMAIPTLLRIEANRIVITDVASGQSVTQQVVVMNVEADRMQVELHSNFAQTNKTTTFQFDATGFWLCESTLFSNYRERFEKIKNP